MDTQWIQWILNITWSALLHIKSTDQYTLSICFDVTSVYGCRSIVFGASRIPL